MVDIMICMIYISSAALGLSDKQIVNLVKVSQKSNEQLGITGILLYSGGNFMQLIEGKESAVETLYEKIRQDHRHRDVTLLFREKITQKNFDNWLIGYRNIDNLRKIDPDLLTPFLDEDLNFASYIKNPHRSLQFLEVFKKIAS